MKLLHISLFVVLLLAVTVDGAKKRKNNNRDRDTEVSSRQIEEDQPSARKEDETVLRQRDNKAKEKKEKEEKPLKKAEDESSSEEEEEKKENKTTPVPSRMKRRLHQDEHAIRASFMLIRLKRAESTLKKVKELDQLPMNSEATEARSGRSKRGENTLQKAKELDEIPLNTNEHQHSDHTPTRHRPKRAENTLKKAKEMDQIPMNTQHDEHEQRSRGRRSDNSHPQTGEVVLSRAQELNDGEKTPLVIDDRAGSRPDYRRKSNSRSRRNGEIVLGKAQELNGGERTALERDETASMRPDYRKNSRTRRTLMHRRYSRVRRTNAKSSEEDTLKKAEELNGGVQRPVDNQPSQSQMPEKVKAHRRRSARDLFNNQPGQQFDERDTEEWKIENEEDYDDGGNS